LDNPSNQTVDRAEIMNKRLISTVLIVLIAAGGFGGYVALQQISNSPSQGGDSPVSVVDDAGRTVTINEIPSRIVSLAPSTTEILFGLGLADKVIGLVSYSGYDTYIQDAITNQNITVVGTFNKVNVEIVTGLQPDLIVASGAYQQSLAANFEEQGKTTIILNPTEFSGILSDIRLLGNVTGKGADAIALVNNMQSKVDDIENRTNDLGKPSVYVEYYMDKGGYYSYGAASYVNELISMAGGVNVFAGDNKQYETTDTETLIGLNASIVVISKGVMSQMSGITPDSIKAREGWSTIDALKNDKIFEINESLLTIWGPRIVDGLDALARVIHPEAFATAAALAPNVP
jgi:iron complex transport system substrate-binding protein